MNLSLLPSVPPQSPATGGTELALGPALLLRAVQKHWLIVLVLFGLCIAGSSVVTATRTPIYEATSTVQLDPQPLLPMGREVSPGGLQRGPDGYWSNLEYFATQRQILQSRKVAGLVVKKLALNRDASFIANVSRAKAPPPTEVPVDVAAQVLRGRITVKAVQESRLALVALADADPERAQRILSVLIDVYVEQNLDSTLDSANKTAEWLDAQLGKLKTELESQEMELHDFKKTNNLLSVSFDDQSNMLRAQIMQLNTALTDLKGKREHVAARLSVLQQVNPEDPSVIPQSELFGNVTLSPLREKYVLAQKELGRLAAIGKGENHPDVKAMRVELEANRAALLGELQNVRNGVSSDLAAVQRELGGVSTLYETAKQQALGLNLNELRFSRLRRSKDSTERVFGMVLERSSESALSKLMPFNNVRVLDRPLKPDSPIEPRPLTNLAFGAALGLVLGLVGALGREALDRTVRNIEEVEQELGISSLGSLPDTSQKGGKGVAYGAYYGKSRRPKRPKTEEEPKPLATPAELLVHTHRNSAGAEAARAVCTNILFMSPDKPIRTLLVTSPGPAEGKTTVATSLAIGLAQTGRKVCLIDCDLRRPRVHSLFGLDATLGVTTTLLDPSGIDQATHETPVPNLWVMPAGPTPPNPADLMHSAAFGKLLDALKERFDTVVLDTPPACLVTDAVVASTRVEACVLVVRSHLTRRDAARRALRSLQGVGANVAGFVMNAVTASTGGSYAYTYYARDEDKDGDHQSAS